MNDNSLPHVFTVGTTERLTDHLTSPREREGGTGTTWRDQTCRMTRACRGEIIGTLEVGGGVDLHPHPFNAT
jgi:hypothetical protein